MAHIKITKGDITIEAEMGDEPVSDFVSIVFALSQTFNAPTSTSAQPPTIVSAQTYNPVQVKSVSPIDRLRRFNPEPGERVIDYIVNAWTKLGSGFVTAQDLYAQMCRDGWHTDSKDPVNVVRATMRKAPRGLFEKSGQSWRYIGPSEAPVPTGTSIDTEDEDSNPSPHHLFEDGAT